jgi:hypothetical protein
VGVRERAGVRLRFDDARTGNEKELAAADRNRADIKGMFHETYSMHLARTA